MSGTDSVGVLENQRGEVLICLGEPGDPEARSWCFPHTEIRKNETPEAAVRRAAAELGLQVKVHTAQPPVARETSRGRKIFRYHFCDVTGSDSDPDDDDNARTGPYAETRWIAKSHLREYDFAEQDADVVAWMLADEPSGPAQ
jgi:8-oxo-dGTP pyrophosphatase MutT (NUDIX family)